MDPEEQVSQGDEQVAETQGQENETQLGTGVNPAWNDFLSELPSSLHNVAIPHLQKWDQNYQEGIGKVHSQYEPYKPFLDQGVQPDQIQYGLQVLDAIQNRPQEVYAAMQQYFGQQGEEEAASNLEEQGQESEPVDITQHPQFQQLAGIVNAMAEQMVQQSTQQQDQQEDEALDQEFQAAKEKFGDFDEHYVMSQLIADAELGNGTMTVEQAVQQYQEFVKGILSQNNRPGPPRVLSGGGASAQTSPNPSQLGDKDRRSLVANMLAASQQQD